MTSPIDPTPGKNNPIRVPPPVEWAEGDPAIQAGVPRLIHVIGEGPQVVGTVAAIVSETLEEQHMIASSTQPGDETIQTADADGTYVDAGGNPFQYRKGDRLPPGYTLRAEPAAPENRAITQVQTPEGGAPAAPENRSRKADKPVDPTA